MAEKISNKNIRIKVFNKFNGKCAYCGYDLNKGNYTIDHIEPKFRKYTNVELDSFNRVRGKCEISNFNPCCKSCNSSKSTFTLDMWREEIGKKYNRLLRDSATFRLLIRFKIVSRISKDILFHFEKHKTNE